MRWIIDGSMFDAGSNEKLLASFEKYGLDFQEINYRPFMNFHDVKELVDLDLSVRYLGYGSINFITKIQKIPELVPGSFCNFRALECRSYYPYLKELLVNDRHVITTWDNFCHNDWHYFNALGHNGCIFLRPNSGRKVFTGAVFTIDSYTSELGMSLRSVTPETVVVIAPPKFVDSEWRFFVSFGKVITGSQFFKKGELHISEDVDRKAYELAEYASKLYTPDPIFVIDVGKLSTGEYKIVELNAFSCAGLYACDSDVLVKEATLAVELLA